MGFQLAQVVPWGRSLADYQGMFALSPADQQRSILDCAGGPASFNLELTQQGGDVISCDPVYQFTVAQIQERIDATYAAIINGVAEQPERFVWKEFASPEQMGQARLQAMQMFLADLPQGLAEGRYHAGELPKLPFVDQAFELALCGHLLFSYSNVLTLEFHQQAILELCRVAREVRIFPVVEQFSGEVSPHLAPIIAHLAAQGFKAEVVTVAYEFQKGGNQMLRIWHPEIDPNDS
jgi:hypothetical protein